jgi:hypothetical protein
MAVTANLPFVVKRMFHLKKKNYLEIMLAEDGQANNQLIQSSIENPVIFINYFLYRPPPSGNNTIL